MENLNEGYIVSHRTPGILISGNYVKNARGIHSEIFNPAAFSAAKIIGNEFIDAGNLISGGVGNEHLCDGLTITGNSFLNTSMKIVSNKGAVVTGNAFRWNSNYQARLTNNEIDTIAANHGITMSGEVIFEGNSLINESPTSAALSTGVFQGYWDAFPGKCQIQNNYIEGFSKGIETGQTLPTVSNQTAITISGNTIVIPTIAGTRYGVLSLISGARVANNKIFAASSANAFGIRVQGVDTDTTPTLIAGEVTGNTVVGCVHWLETSWYDNIVFSNCSDSIPSHLFGSARQRESIGYEINTVDGSRVLSASTPFLFSATRFRFSNEGGFFDQSGGNIRAITSTGNFARLLFGSLGFGVAIPDASAAVDTLYLSSTNGKLSWKDSGGTVNALY
jgi:hypothetical protein